MKICFLALYNTTNQMGYEILKDQGKSTSFHTYRKRGYKPSLEEYLNNGWVSSSGPVILVHAFLLSKLPNSNTSVGWFWTKTQEANVPKWMLAIISKTSFLVVGKKLNEEVRTASPYPPHFIKLCLESCKGSPLHLPAW
ncbi:E-beta-ocimene/myrcene synthase [Cinnamomum micranthum f. kanehirae]|uniref:E-beta-ocimene/myrcene synthase n=1 Tax=Cinnamomum micranthum f. kanehirae TaxID=337451 RepID=A0A443Q520_9MAGN|nr:E-beta-ocimene/myrcene synthase [Cinnamomum micranthum f. kanehirae]